MTTIQKTDAWELAVETETGPYGTAVIFWSYVPTARRPERQTQYKLVLQRHELEALQKVLSQDLAAATI
ncbi:MAG: hypothetical protein ACO25M_00205 [Limnohabitans sp.]